MISYVRHVHMYVTPPENPRGVGNAHFSRQKSKYPYISRHTGAAKAVSWSVWNADGILQNLFTLSPFSPWKPNPIFPWGMGCREEKQNQLLNKLQELQLECSLFTRKCVSPNQNISGETRVLSGRNPNAPRRSILTSRPGRPRKPGGPYIKNEWK